MFSEENAGRFWVNELKNYSSNQTTNHTDTQFTKALKQHSPLCLRTERLTAPWRLARTLQLNSKQRTGLSQAFLLDTIWFDLG